MLYERREKILELLALNKRVKINELLEIFNVSIETIRRDLEALENEGCLKRVYGGAILENNRGLEISLSTRSNLNTDEKIKIATKAVEMINDGDTIIFDSGTTCAEIAKRINKKENLTILTNSIHIAMDLFNHSDHNIYFIGGKMRKNELATSGFLAEKFLDNFSVDKCFIGIGGITLEDGITDYHIEECNLRNEMMKSSKSVIAVCDNSKFGVKALFKVSKLDEIDILITDDLTPKAFLEDIRNLGVKVEVVED